MKFELATVVGSHAYGIAQPSSDVDVAAVYLSKPIILGFDRTPPQTRRCRIHNLDLTAYSIGQFFRLCAQGNPNMLDVLFSSQRLRVSELGQHILDNRSLFVSQQAIVRYQAYAHNQIACINKNPALYTKAIVNVVRLGLQCEQLLVEHTIDLTRNAAVLNEIKKDVWTVPQLLRWWQVHNERLVWLQARTSLPERPDEARIRALLQVLVQDFKF